MATPLKVPAGFRFAGPLSQLPAAAQRAANRAQRAATLRRTLARRHRTGGILAAYTATTAS